MDEEGEGKQQTCGYYISLIWNSMREGRLLKQKPYKVHCLKSTLVSCLINFQQIFIDNWQYIKLCGYNKEQIEAPDFYFES